MNTIQQVGTPKQLTRKELFDEIAISFIKLYNKLEKLRRLYTNNKDLATSIIQIEQLLFVERARLKKLLNGL